MMLLNSHYLAVKLHIVYFDGLIIVCSFYRLLFSFMRHGVCHWDPQAGGLRGDLPFW